MESVLKHSFRFTALVILSTSLSLTAHAQSGGSGIATNPSAIPSGKKEESNLFEQSSPYLEYGDFNSSEDEDADTLYFQYGRFFGISLGAGYQAATGNRGKLYDTAFPRIDLQVHYWFDFQFALVLGVYFANHTYSLNNVNTTVKLIGYGVDLKYYFDVRNAAAPIAFANPFLLLGAGNTSKTETTPNVTDDTDSSFTVGAGAGLEFPISYRKTYFTIQGKYNTQSFNDTNATRFSSRVPNLGGGFISVIGSLLFVW